MILPPKNTPKSVDSYATRTTLACIAVLTKLLYLTLRVSSSKETKKIFSDKSPSAIFSWHDSISMLPYLNTYLRRKRPITGLMSASKDDAYLAEFFRHFGARAERGSSSRGGSRSAVNLIRNLRRGGNICITPDGPRGPKYSVAGGMFTICKKCPQTRMIFVKFRFSSSWKLNSWDNFNIPKPFSKIEIEACEYANFSEFSTEADIKKNLPRKFVRETSRRLSYAKENSCGLSSCKQNLLLGR